jgi:Rrf2 family protein
VALARTARSDRAVFISDIAASERIPRKFPEQILLDLKHHGIVESRRGKAGGYLPLKAPENITFGEVLRIVDGPIAPCPASATPRVAARIAGKKKAAKSGKYSRGWPT